MHLNLHPYTFFHGYDGDKQTTVNSLGKAQNISSSIP
jgi:hypothetical protein